MSDKLQLVGFSLTHQFTKRNDKLRFVGQYELFTRTKQGRLQAPCVRLKPTANMQLLI